MPWGDRAKRFLGKGGDKNKDNDKKKSVERGSGADKAKENEVKIGVNLDTTETRAMVDQSHQQTAQHDIQEVAEAVKDRNLVPQVIATPILNYPPGDTLDVQGKPNQSTKSIHNLRKASPLDPNKEKLWDQAYSELRKKEPDLIKAYEGDLLSFQTQHNKGMLSSISFTRNCTHLCFSYSRYDQGLN